MQYYVPGFVAYGIMSACYNILAIAMVNRREMGLLKRVRLSPVPTWILMAAIFLSSMIIAARPDGDPARGRAVRLLASTARPTWRRSSWPCWSACWCSRRSAWR